MSRYETEEERSVLREKVKTQDYLKPVPPPPRLWCDWCGDISATGKHTNWLCQFFEWLEKRE